MPFFFGRGNLAPETPRALAIQPRLSRPLRRRLITSRSMDGSRRTPSARWHGDRWRFHGSGEHAVAALGLRSLEGIETFAGGELVAGSRTSWVRRVKIAGGSAVFAKCFYYPTPLDLVLRIVSRRMWWHRAEREWRSLQIQESLGLPTVARLALGERRRFGLLRSALLVTEEFEGAIRLDRWLAASARSAPNGAGPAVAALAAWVARVHRAGFVHGDLNARNVLVSQMESAPPAFRTIDAGRGARARWRGRVSRRHARDLAPITLACELILGAEWSTRFLGHYASDAAIGDLRSDEHVILREVSRVRSHEARRLDPATLARTSARPTIG